jgi:hypothetical protein
VALWQQPGVGIAALFCTFATTACLRGLRSVYEIKVFRDGTIIFDRVWGTTTLTAEDIHSLEGHYKKDYDGDLVWEMRLQGSGLRENFDQFDSVMSFVDTVKAHNPNVVITGLWPMGTPR